ncbi:MAG TPA: enoyl-CoA hydratase/isomerase family protein, partial [Burkholderiales bacterium]
MRGVLYSFEAGVATIMLDRPEARNALNGAMCDALRESAERAAADESVRLVLVRGNGPVFCAGADIKEREGMSKAQVRE